MGRNMSGVGPGTEFFPCLPGDFSRVASQQWGSSKWCILSEMKKLQASAPFLVFDYYEELSLMSTSACPWIFFFS